MYIVIKETLAIIFVAFETRDMVCVNQITTMTLHKTQTVKFCLYTG